MQLISVVVTLLLHCYTCKPNQTIKPVSKFDSSKSVQQYSVNTICTLYQTIHVLKTPDINWDKCFCECVSVFQNIINIKITQLRNAFIAIINYRHYTFCVTLLEIKFPKGGFGRHRTTIWDSCEHYNTIFQYKDPFGQCKASTD